MRCRCRRYAPSWPLWRIFNGATHAYESTLSVTAPLLLWQHVERPVDWPRWFGRQAPVVVEIGFGNGEFLVREAQAHPERNFIGIEPEWPSVQRACVAWRRRAPNVRLLLVDARIAMERLFSSDSAGPIRVFPVSLA